MQFVQRHQPPERLSTKPEPCKTDSGLSGDFPYHAENFARFIEKLGLEAIILSEQPNEGTTIIEKIEDYADVGFAIVLYTPCDEGRAINSSDLKQRARQNVVFEHGFFIGQLGRDHVHALKKGEIELPNDISGVIYTPMDEAKAWQYKIAKEMRTVGYNIDLNKL